MSKDTLEVMSEYVIRGLVGGFCIAMAIHQFHRLGFIDGFLSSAKLIKDTDAELWDKVYEETVVKKAR